MIDKKILEFMDDKRLIATVTVRKEGTTVKMDCDAELDDGMYLMMPISDREHAQVIVKDCLRGMKVRGVPGCELPEEKAN